MLFTRFFAGGLFVNNPLVIVIESGDFGVFINLIVAERAFPVLFACRRTGGFAVDNPLVIVIESGNHGVLVCFRVAHGAFSVLFARRCAGGLSVGNPLIIVLALNNGFVIFGASLADSYGLDAFKAGAFALFYCIPVVR